MSANGFTLDKRVYEFSKLELLKSGPDVINCATDDQEGRKLFGQGT